MITEKIIVEIDNLSPAQKIALEDLFATWQILGSIGSSRWTKFYADGDGTFNPKITVNGEKPKLTDLITREEVWSGKQNYAGEYQIDFDTIAWKLRTKED